MKRRSWLYVLGVLVLACADGVGPDPDPEPDADYTVQLDAGSDSLGALMIVILGDGAEELLVESDDYRVYSAWQGEPGTLSVIVVGRAIVSGPLVDVLAPDSLEGSTFNAVISRMISTGNESRVDYEAFQLVVERP